jgi:hypothetical protein
MTQVYRYSVLNISAARAKNVSERLFSERDPENISPLPPCPPFRDFDWREYVPSQSDQTWCLMLVDIWDELLIRTPVF